MTEQDERLALATSYVEVSQYAAWKDLMKRIDRINEDALKKLDDTFFGDLSLNHAVYVKAVRMTIERIKREITNATNGNP